MKHNLMTAAAVLAIMTAAGAARAADLSVVKAPAPAPIDCYSNFETWFYASPKDCPLKYGPLTLFGTLDLGAGWNEAGIPYGGRYDKGVYYGIKKLSRGSRWNLAQNPLSTTGFGIKLKQKITDEWDLIGQADTGWNPYSGMFANGPKSLTDMNRTKAINTNANDDSSRAGQWANGQAYIGLSNKTLGDVTFGRQNALNSDVIAAYDPVKSNAFSPIGFSSSYAGWGSTEIARVNTAIEYNGKYALDQYGAVVRFAGQAQVGNGYYLGNGAMADYSGNIGVDWNGFSVDAVGGFAKDAVALSSLYNSLPTNLKPGLTYNWNDVLPATLSNNLGWTFAGKYKWDAYTVYAGYAFLRQMSPSDQYAQGFDTIAPGISVPGNVPASLTTNGKGYTWVTTNKYLTNRVLNTYWIGGKWDTPYKDLAFNTGIYYSTQPNYNTSWASCNGKNNYYNSGSCAGSQLSYAFLVTYKVLKRVDIYAGVMVSSVFGGQASGYYKQQSIDPTAGIRFNF